MLVDHYREQGHVTKTFISPFSHTRRLPLLITRIFLYNPWNMLWRGVCAMFGKMSHYSNHLLYPTCSHSWSNANLTEECHSESHDVSLDESCTNPVTFSAMICSLHSQRVDQTPITARWHPRLYTTRLHFLQERYRPFHCSEPSPESPNQMQRRSPEIHQ